MNASEPVSKLGIPTDTAPLVTIAIPTKNEARHIGDVLKRILDNGYPLASLELVVVDAGSTDETMNIVRRSSAQFARIEAFEVTGCTVYEGLNIALRRATGAFFMRVDARSHIPPGYIQKCIDNLRTTGASGTGGVQRQFGVDSKSRAIALATAHPFGVGNARFRLGKTSGFVDTVYLGCYPKALLDELGGFDDDGVVVSEDSALNQRIIDIGGKIYLDVDLVVQYPAKRTLKELARQYFIYGGAKAHTALKYQKFTSTRQIIPLAFLFWWILWGLLWFSFPWAGAIFVLSLASYLVAVLMVSLKISLAAGETSLFGNLVGAFACIHFCWPIGFIARAISGNKLAKFVFAR